MKRKYCQLILSVRTLIFDSYQIMLTNSQLLRQKKKGKQQQHSQKQQTERRHEQTNEKTYYV